MLTLGIIAYIVVGLATTFGALYFQSKHNDPVNGKDVWYALFMFGLCWIFTVPVILCIFVCVESSDIIACKINQFVHNKGK